MLGFVRKNVGVIAASAISLFAAVFLLPTTARAITLGDFEVTDTETGGDPDTSYYSYEDGDGEISILDGAKVTIAMADGKSSTNMGIYVKQDANAEITLAGVNIRSSARAPFRICDDSNGNVTIILKEGTENYLESVDCRYAGLQKNSGSSSGTLTIKGKGYLEAEGNDNPSNNRNNISEYPKKACDYGGSAGIGGSYKKGAANIFIEDGSIVAVGHMGAAGIGGGWNGECSNIKITGGSVIASSDSAWTYKYILNKIKSKKGVAIGNGITYTIGTVKVNGTNKKCVTEVISKSVTPKNDNGENVYEFKLNTTGASYVKIDGKDYPTKHGSKQYLYVYLTKNTEHIAEIDGLKSHYTRTGSTFMVTPYAESFKFTVPSNLTFTGTAKAASVTTNATGMGAVTVKYYDENGNKLDSVPVAAGTYTVKIDVAGSSTCNAATDITDPSWTFTIEKGTLIDNGNTGTFGGNVVNKVITGFNDVTCLGEDGTTEVTVNGHWEADDESIYAIGTYDNVAVTFIPDSYADSYTNTLTYTIPKLIVGKADAPTIADTDVTNTVTESGEKYVDLAGMPELENMQVTAEIYEDEYDIFFQNAAYKNGKIYYYLSDNNVGKASYCSRIIVTVSSDNYKDIKYYINVTLVKNGREAITDDDYTVTLSYPDNSTCDLIVSTENEDLRFSLDGDIWTNSLGSNGLAHGQEVTLYICYTETDTHYSTDSITRTIKVGHGTLTEHVEVPADCMNGGSILYYTCDSCNKFFSDKDGKTEITEEQTSTTALGHDCDDDVWVNDDASGHWHACSRCSEQDSFAEHVSSGSATPDTPETCTVCGYVITPALGYCDAPVIKLTDSESLTFTGSASVSITCEDGAKVYYTLDGTEPSYDENGATLTTAEYTDPFNISTITTVKAIAVKSNKGDSVVAEVKFDKLYSPSDFNITYPDNLTFNGLPKVVTVSATSTSGMITVKYYDANGLLLDNAPVEAGAYTVKIDVTASEGCAETNDISVGAFTIAKATLYTDKFVINTSYGDTFSELLENCDRHYPTYGDKNGDTVQGYWKANDDYWNNVVLDAGVYDDIRLVFVPYDYPDCYNPLYVEPNITIKKAIAPTYPSVSTSYIWATTGEESVDVPKLPEDCGSVSTGNVSIGFSGNDSAIIVPDSVKYKDGEISFTLGDNKREDVGKVAEIIVNVPTLNYENITYSVLVTLTAKKNQNAPEQSDFTLELSPDGNTYIAEIITELEGVEYSFDGENWSETSTLSGIAHATDVTAYIRYKETATHNESAPTMKNATTAHGTLTYHKAVEEKCEEDGNIEYWTCDSCELYFSDKNALTRITQAETVIDRKGHNPSEKWSSDGTKHWHSCKNTGCTKHLDEADCKGGTATCVNKAICDICKHEHGSTAGHSYSDKWTYSKTYHWHKCINCDAKKNKTEHKYDENGNCSCGYFVPAYNLTAVAGNRSVTLSWDKTKGATGYIIKSADGEIQYTPKTIQTTSYTVTGLMNGKTYQFRVYVYVGGKWYVSSKISKMPVAKPQNVQAIRGNMQITLTWDKVDGATGYIVKSADGKTKYTEKSIKTNSFTVTGLTNGKQYKFKVYAYSDGKWFASSTISRTPVGNPQNVKAIAGNKLIKLTWDKVDGATGYIVKSADGKTKYTEKSIKTNSYTITGLKNEVQYKFRVYAYCNGKWFVSSTVTKTPTAAPQNVTATAGSKQVTLTWDKVDGARGYIVKSADGKTKYTEKTIKTTSYIVTNLTGGTQYKFKVYAYVDGTWYDSTTVTKTTKK